MSLDLAGLLVVCAGALAGALFGALRQLVHLGALLAGLLAARLLGPPLADRLGLGSGPLGRPLLALGLLAATYLGATLVARLLLSGGEAGRRGGADRGLGALLGGAQAALATWAAVSLLALWGQPVGPPALGLDPRRGDLGAIGRDHSLLALVAPAEAARLRQQLEALRQAGPGNPLERARQAAEAADQALKRQVDQLERAR